MSLVETYLGTWCRGGVEYYVSLEGGVDEIYGTLDFKLLWASFDLNLGHLLLWIWNCE